MKTGKREADDTVYVAVAQFASIADTQANIRSIAGLAARAAAAGARLAIFPEASSYRFTSSGDELLRVAENDGPAFRAAMGEIARKNDIVLVVGLYALGNDRKRSDNLLVVFSADGCEQGSYHKLHLYDAFQYRESDKNTPGDLKADFAELMVFDRLCDHVLVMRNGKVVEAESTAKLFRNPAHPYTADLISAVPGGSWLNPEAGRGRSHQNDQET